MGLTLTPLSQKFSDAQFYELKKYTAVQIAGAFGISPTFINNYDHASYSNSEAEQLHFLVNTMSASLKAYEEEQERRKKAENVKMLQAQLAAMQEKYGRSKNADQVHQ